MIAWTIEAAVSSSMFARVIVSTDDPEIAEVARHHGAAVPFLREAHADDVSPVSLATVTALEQLRQLGESYDTVVQLMANCPLRRGHHIVDALTHFEQRSAQSQVSCFRFGWMNPWWAATLTPDGHPVSLFPESATLRSQDLPPLYCPTGATWIAQVAHLDAHRTFHTPQRIFCPMAWDAAVDIDDRDDLRMAEALYSMRTVG